MIKTCNFPNLNKNRRGFTLLEMMLVVLIISILLAIAIPSFLKARESSQTRACISDLRHIQDAKERWAMDFRKTNEDIPNVADIAPTYLKTFPTCPGGGSYEIGTVGDNATCSIGLDHILD